MTTQQQHKIQGIGGEVSDTCANPHISKQIPEYVNNPLEDPSAKVIENHLLECRSCREFFILLLQLRSVYGNAGKQKARRRKALKSANVVTLADFKKAWP